MTTPRATQRLGATQHLIVATALALASLDASNVCRIRTARQLVSACRTLQAQCAREGTHYPAQQVAVDSAAVLTTLAARFRRAAKQLQPTERGHRNEHNRDI